MLRAVCPGDYLRSQGLLNNDVWHYLRAWEPKHSDCRLIAFLKLVARGAGYSKMARIQVLSKDTPGEAWRPRLLGGSA